VAPHGSHERPSHQPGFLKPGGGGLAVPEQSISHKPDQEIGVFFKRSGASASASAPFFG